MFPSILFCRTYRLSSPAMTCITSIQISYLTMHISVCVTVACQIHVVTLSASRLAMIKVGGAICPISLMSPKLVFHQFVVLAWSCRCPVNILQVTPSTFSQMALLSVPRVCHELVKSVSHASHLSVQQISGV